MSKRYPQSLFSVFGIGWQRIIAGLLPLGLATAAIAFLGSLPGNCYAGVLFGPVLNPANGHAYFLLTESSWQAAQSEAAHLGGNLVTINDATEHAWIFSTFGSQGAQNRSLWLGLTDQASEGHFVWMSGEFVGYSNWLPGQPDNSGNEDYVHMIREGLGVNGGPWNDVSSPTTPFSNFSPINGVVEVNSPSVLLGPIVNPANEHTYYLLTQSSWQAAQAQALTLDGNLATINDAAEQAWVFSEFGFYGGQERSLWLGLNDEAVEGSFVWASGEPVGYYNWLPGLPDNAYGDENYVHMMRSGNGFGHPGGTWNDLASPISPFPQFDPIHGVVEVNSVPVPSNAVTWGYIKSNHP